MRKIILAITLTTSIVALFFTMQAFADNIQTAAVSTSQSPYPPPEILLTNTHVSTDFLASTPYPEPLDMPVVSPVLSNSSFDVTESLSG